MKLGGEISFTSTVSPSGYYERTRIEALPNGGFVNIWTDADNTTVTLGAAFDAANAQVGNAFILSMLNMFSIDTVKLSNGDLGFIYLTGSAAQSGEGPGGVVKFQKFLTDGTLVGPAVNLATDVNLTSSLPGDIFEVNADRLHTLVLSNGGFVLNWTGFDGGAGLGQFGTGGGAYGRFFSSAGVPTSGVIQLDNDTLGLQRSPISAQLADGNVVSTWNSSGSIYAQIFTDAGVRIGGEFTVSPPPNINTATGEVGVDPSITALADGGFVITFASDRDPVQAANSDIVGISGQRFSANGTPLGTIFDLNTVTLGPQRASSVVQGADGTLIAAWHSGDDIAMQRLALPANLAPFVTSAATANFAEDGTGIAYQAMAGDQNGETALTFSLAGTDAALFNINAATGAVRFNAAPDFEAAADMGGDNVYDLTIEVTDPSGLMGTANVAITVTDVAATLIGTPASETLTGGAGADNIQGLGRNDTLIGNAGDDTLNGGAGVDNMQGGMGNDTYMVDSRADIVTELANAGTDLVLSTAGRFTLGDHVENLTYTGSGRFTGTGNALDNVITGAGKNDTLNGGGGNDNLMGLGGNDRLNGGIGEDVLDGGAGPDALTGGAGNDIFLFRRGEASGDTVTDFIGNGNAAGDKLHFVGYGSTLAGASFTDLGANIWQITSADGMTMETIEVVGSVGARDWMFV